MYLALLRGGGYCTSHNRGAVVNEFQWRTVAVLIRGHLGLRRPLSTKRAMAYVAELDSGTRTAPVWLSLLAAINEVRQCP